jgi:hypothetical protein
MSINTDVRAGMHSMVVRAPSEKRSNVFLYTSSCFAGAARGGGYKLIKSKSLVLSRMRTVPPRPRKLDGGEEMPAMSLAFENLLCNRI